EDMNCYKGSTVYYDLDEDKYVKFLGLIIDRYLESYEELDFFKWIDPQSFQEHVNEEEKREHRIKTAMRLLKMFGVGDGYLERVMRDKGIEDVKLINEKSLFTNSNLTKGGIELNPTNDYYKPQTAKKTVNKKNQIDVKNNKKINSFFKDLLGLEGRL
ncbi:hypothetical protein ROZALSC1DRAFT_31985, partial [Rozella allomycis CSF55]